MIPLIDSILNAGTTILNKFIPDANKKLEAQQEFERLLHEAELAQVAVNLEEAKNTNLFVSGWRPSVGWVCAGAFAYHFIAQPSLVFLLSVVFPQYMTVVPKLPQLDMASLMTVLMGMLGLGTLRTYEKTRK